ncbi:kinase-like protein [Aspergillus avenaceus]|uniref:Kinase-like protein n=1 Tax=Aspergillus avenaceus TaxID=36643 RepID=A0A5N6U0W5_ASPAV|nr:kinase-like protein [Aspergillus avenaceus]
MSGAEENQNAQPVDCRPQVNILYSAPGFAVPYPDSINTTVNSSNTIFDWGGVKIAKISPEVVVKFGSHVTVSEAKSMMFVEQNTETVPVPKIFAFYSYGPIDRDIEDYGSLFDTYIFMSFVEGYFCELRQINPSHYIGSVDLGPVTDPILEGYGIKGPFDSEDDFNNAIIDAYQSKAPKCCIKNVLAGMLSQRRHYAVFTHGDLRLQNIIVNNGNVTGILDWEFSGWYPEYWEFAKALYVWKWQNDWTEYLAQILEPYYSEYAVHSFLTETLW